MSQASQIVLRDVPRTNPPSTHFIYFIKFAVLWEIESRLVKAAFSLVLVRVKDGDDDVDALVTRNVNAAQLTADNADSVAVFLEPGIHLGFYGPCET